MLVYVYISIANSEISPKSSERLIYSYRKHLLQVIVVKGGFTCYWIIWCTYLFLTFFPNVGSLFGKNDYILKSVAFFFFAVTWNWLFIEVGEENPIVNLTLIKIKTELKDGVLSYSPHDYIRIKSNLQPWLLPLCSISELSGHWSYPIQSAAPDHI